MAVTLLLSASRIFGAIAKTGLNVLNKKSSKKSSTFSSITDHYVIPENREEMLKMKVEIANEVVENAKNYLDENDIDYTMDLSDSIGVSIVGDTVYVIVDSAHGSVVEYGLAPGTAVNIDALRKWVEGKLGIHDPEERDKVTFKIFNKIKKEGIKPTKFFTKSILALKKNQPRVPRKKKSGLERTVSKIKKISRKTRKYIRYVGIK